MRLRECRVNWSLELMDCREVGHHHAKCLRLVNTTKNLPADSLQLINNLVGQREDERRVDTLKRNVQPWAVIERQNLRLCRLGFEIHDDVFGQGVFVADFQHSKKLVEVCLCELGIDREPDLRPLLCGSDDSALRAGCGLRLRCHAVSSLDIVCIRTICQERKYAN